MGIYFRDWRDTKLGSLLSVTCRHCSVQSVRTESRCKRQFDPQCVTLHSVSHCTSQLATASERTDYYDHCPNLSQLKLHEDGPIARRRHLLPYRGFTAPVIQSVWSFSRTSGLRGAVPSREVGLAKCQAPPKPRGRRPRRIALFYATGTLRQRYNEVWHKRPCEPITITVNQIRLAIYHQRTMPLTDSSSALGVRERGSRVHNLHV